MNVRERTVGPVTVLDPVGALVLDDTRVDTALKDTVGRLMSAAPSPVHDRSVACHTSRHIRADEPGCGAGRGVEARRAHQAVEPDSATRVSCSPLHRLNKFFEICGTEREAIEKLDTETRAGI